MGMIDEFKQFAMQGNVVDLAVGVVIGSAFGNVITAFTTGFIQPLLNMIGGNNIGLKIWIFDIGILINAIISFTLTALVIFFLIVKPLGKMSKKLAKTE